MTCSIHTRLLWKTIIINNHIRLGTFHKVCIFKQLEANRVNLWHTCYFGVLRGAELESAVCPAQKWLISPKNETSNMAATAVLK